MKSAAVGLGPTDGATGQPVRAATAPAIYRNDCASAPDRFREAEGLDLEPVDVPPDFEGIAAVEDRAHTDTAEATAEAVGIDQEKSTASTTDVESVSVARAEARAQRTAWYTRYLGTPTELVPQPYARPLP